MLMFSCSHQDEMRLNRSMTPSQSSGSLTPSRRPHCLPNNINKELERKIGNEAALKAKNGKIVRVARRGLTVVSLFLI